MGGTKTGSADEPTAGAHLPAEVSLGPVRLQVADLDRSIAYYRSVIGMEALEMEGNRAVLGVPDEGTALLELVENTRATPAPEMGRLGLYHFAILLPDRPALGRFARHLGELGERVGASDHLVSEAFYLHDPDGLGIEVYADRPRSSWRWNGDQLEMSSLPLDLRGLVGAAGAEPWRGLPSGTIIGHMHLHVGELGAAERFYHVGVGLDVVVRGYPGALFLSAGGYHHHFGLNTWARGARPAGPDDARLLEWELRLPDEQTAESVMDRLRAQGCDGTRESRAWLVVDPWGTALRISWPARAWPAAQ